MKLSHIRSNASFLALLSLSAVFYTVPLVAALPPDFEDTFVTTVSGPIDMVWTPDGRMLIIGKNGQLRVYAGGALVPTPALDLSGVVCSNGERGLVGITLHPDFAVNHYLYLFYTFNKFMNSCPESELSGPVGRLSRFVLPDTNVIDRASELVLFDTPPMFHDHHTGGDLKFGKDGYLYVTVGDSGARTLGWPQDAGKLAGKVVRITDSGGIPLDNPFTGPGTARCNVNGVPPAGSPAGTKCQEIFTIGLRNPFRMAMDPNAANVRFYINDVGQHTWEEIDEGPLPGGNYGWSIREGPCTLNSDTDCGPPPPGMTNPVWWYHHDVSLGGAAVTGAAFVPNGLWPGFDGAYLYADYVWGKMFKLTCCNSTGGFISTEFHSAAQVVSHRFGPHGTTQALYYTTRDGSQVRRIAFTGSLNRAPVARATADPSFGLLPLEVRFDGTGSSDPDGDLLSYQWDLDGNGSTDATGPTPVYTYTIEGSFLATLTVRDGRGGQGSVTLRIDAGNTPPSPIIESPSPGTLFAVGDTFILHGSATDPQEGSLPVSALAWDVIRHHSTHFHPFLELTNGNDIAIVAPEPEDLDAARTSFLEIFLTATDSKGLSRRVSLELHPKFVDLNFETVPSGLTLKITAITFTAPFTVRSWEAYMLQVEALDQFDSSGRFWIFDAWSDGGAAAHTITTPQTVATYSATFKEAPAPPTPTTVTFTAVADTYVKGDEPLRNFGGRSSLRTDASPDRRSYIRFDLRNLGPLITKATLRVFANSGNTIGYDVHGVPDNTWEEMTMTYSNAPSFGPVVDSSGTVVALTWTEVDVTSLVSGNGLLSFAMTSPSTTATTFASREAGANAPHLIVSTTGSGPDTIPPSTPTALTAVGVSAYRVDLEWLPSTDSGGSGVAGYDVFRDASYLATLGVVISYSDSTVSPLTTYQYQVRAKDGAGNLSPFSETLVVNTPAPSPVRTVVFSILQDTYVRQDSPLTSFGSATTFNVDGSPVKHGLVMVEVVGVGTGTVVEAKLRFRVFDSGGGGDLHITDNSWSEGVTWDSAPAYDPAVVASFGGVAAGTWAEVDITSVVRGDGIYSFRITSLSSNGADYYSTEGPAEFMPQLVITYIVT